MKSLDETIREAVRIAIEEDAAGNDITTKLLVPPGARGEASISARACGIVSGQDCAKAVFGSIDPAVIYEAAVRDGGRVAAGGEVARIEGPLRAILSGERTALNFLAHLSGIATRAAQFVEKVKGTGVRILDTRKTTPGLRLLEKKAVVDGGAENHRPDLSSLVLVKENHIEAAGGLERMIEAMGGSIRKAEVEVSSLGELRALEDYRPRRIMLDNFPSALVSEALRILDSWTGTKPEIEVSGGITLDNIGEYAMEGIDFISVGSLTSSTVSLDLTLLVRSQERKRDGRR